MRCLVHQATTKFMLCLSRNNVHVSMRFTMNCNIACDLWHRAMLVIIGAERNLHRMLQHSCSMCNGNRKGCFSILTAMCCSAPSRCKLRQKQFERHALTFVACLSTAVAARAGCHGSRGSQSRHDIFAQRPNQRANKRGCEADFHAICALPCVKPVAVSDRLPFRDT